MFETTIDNCHKCDREQLMIQVIVNISGLIEEIQKLKQNVIGEPFSIKTKTHRDKNIEKKLTKIK